MNLWERWRDWRDQRSALKEMDQLRQRDEAALVDLNLNPLNLAKLSIVSNPEEAASQWEHARRLLPNAVVESDDSLNILLGLKRYDEADALMRQRQKRFPRDSFCLTALARIAEERGDITEALKRWDVVRQRVRNTLDGYTGCARCLVSLGRLDEADHRLSQALRIIPNNFDALTARARISDRRKDWERSLARWQHIAEMHRYTSAFASAARVMMELGRIDDAEAWLTEPSQVFAGDLEIALTRAELAQRRGDLTAACDRWTTVRAADPQLPAGYYQGASRLAEAGRHTEADAVLRRAIERFPDEVWPLQNFARMAHDRRDWDEAALRWAALRQRFPEEASGFSMGAEALKAAGRDDEAASLRPAP